MQGLSVTISFFRASMKGFLFCLFFFIPLACIAETQAIAVLLDVTKTIPLDDFAKSKEIVQQMILEKSPTTNLTVYAFGNNLREIDPALLTDTQRNDVITSLYDAVYDVAQKLENVSADHKAIVLITDGLDNNSATTIDDSMSFSKTHGIVIHPIGVGKVSGKSLERIARVTGGTVFELNTPDVSQKIQEAISSQPQVAAAQPSVEPNVRPSIPEQVQPAPAPTQSQRPSMSMPQPETGRRPSGLMARYSYLLWIVGAGIIAVPVVLWLVTRAFKKEERPCPSCGKPLEPFQTFCPECAAVPKTIVAPARSFAPDSTQEIKRHVAPEPFDPPSLPPEILIKQADADEVLSKTFVLMDKPLLVVRKGKNIGQAFTLNRSVPISIGRSRVCEIKLEDTTVSGQHCRIIPESGKHFLYDLRSTNGTFVNEKKVRKVELKEGDVIKVGETQFLYKVEQHRNN